MPPPDTPKQLTSEESLLLRAWVTRGAQWSPHWSYVAPASAPAPRVTNEAWVRQAIDRFVLKKLEDVGLEPSEEAGREQLLRRVTLDLTGLPPTPEEIATFLADRDPDAYERQVDRLLSSPRYGEHMARYWLDAVRYGDTHGLHLDNERWIWPYRDWVIRSFDEDLPFDEFTLYQLAGDLLPQPTRDQLVATGYLRCHVTTNEGGNHPQGSLRSQCRRSSRNDCYRVVGDDRRLRLLPRSQVRPTHAA